MHLLAAFFSVGVHQADELYQVFEFAGYKLGLNTAASLPWEFSEQMRSGIQPFLIWILTKAAHTAGIANPFHIAILARTFMSLFAFAAMIGLTRLLEKEVRNEGQRRILWMLSLLFWLLPYFHARFSSENFSVTLFVAGLVLVLHPHSSIRYIWLFIAGLLFGLAFESRFQIVFMVAGLGLWQLVLQRVSPAQFIPQVLGFSAALGLGALSDYWLYGKWTLSWWNYLDLNFFQDKASHFGTEPFYFYFSEGFLQLLPPFSLVIIAAIPAFWYFFPAHWITWVTLPFTVLHFFVAHKELRFLMPVLDFIPFILVMFVGQGLEAGSVVRNFLSSRALLRFAWAVNLLAMLFMALKPADQSTLALRNIYDRVEGEKPVLYYEGNDPYDMFSLNYFRNADIQTEPHDVDPKVLQSDNLYFFSEKLIQPEIMVHRNRAYYRIYSNFPDWIRYLDFNGWVERAGRYSIYKAVPLN